MTALDMSGLLGMHAMAGGHAPGPAGHSPPQPLAQPVSAIVGPDAVLPSLLDDIPPAAAVAAQLAGSGLPSGPLMALISVCVAVMLGLGVLLAATTHRRTTADRSPRPPPTTVPRSRLLTRAPPPDLLTELCVLRT